jgi:hypothetical protein
MALRKKALRPIARLGALTLVLFVAGSLRAQNPRPVAFIAENYDVSATLDTIRQSLTATAKVDFKALEVSGNVRVELHPNLEVQSVKSADGKLLNFERDRQNPLFLIVTVPSPVGAGGHVSLTFAYTGLLGNEENSPVPGVRLPASALAVVSADGLSGEPIYRNFSIECAGVICCGGYRQSFGSYHDRWKKSD